MNTIMLLAERVDPGIVHVHLHTIANVQQPADVPSCMVSTPADLADQNRIINTAMSDRELLMTVMRPPASATSTGTWLLADAWQHCGLHNSACIEVYCVTHGASSLG